MRNRSHILIVFRSSVLFFLATGLAARSKAADTCDLSVVPQEVRAELDKHYPDWQPERIQHLYEDDQAAWVKAHPNDCPGIAIGHFESKDELSYAFLLISKPDRKRPGFRVVAFSRSGATAQYVSHLVTKWNIGLYYVGSDEVIARVPPGKYEEAIGSKKAHTDLDSILCETIEKGAAVYYWKNGRYHELITSE